MRWSLSYSRNILESIYNYSLRFKSNFSVIDFNKTKQNMVNRLKSGILVLPQTKKMEKKKYWKLLGIVNTTPRME